MSTSLEKYRQSITDISDNDVVLLLNDVFAIHPNAGGLMKSTTDKQRQLETTKNLSTTWRDSISSLLASTPTSKKKPITLSVTSNDITVTADISYVNMKQENTTTEKKETAKDVTTSSTSMTEREKLETRISISSVTTNYIETNEKSSQIKVENLGDHVTGMKRSFSQLAPLNTTMMDEISSNFWMAPKMTERDSQSFSLDLSSPNHRLPSYSSITDALPSEYSMERRMTYPFIDIHPPSSTYPPEAQRFHTPPIPYLSGVPYTPSPLVTLSRRSSTIEATNAECIDPHRDHLYDTAFRRSSTSSRPFFSFPPLSNQPPQQSTKEEPTTHEEPSATSTSTSTKSKGSSSMYCKIPGCYKKRKLGGRCIAHGGGKRCVVVHCMKSAQSYGLCKAHGGGIRCTYQNCTKSSQGNGFCRAHGGGKRCQAENCNKGAQRGDFCAIHGGVKRCQHPNCHRVERGGGYCQVHRQKKLCTFNNCNEIATKYFLCSKHLES